MRVSRRLWILLGVLAAVVGLRVAWSTATFAWGGRWDAVGPGLAVRTFYWKAPNVLVRVTAVRAEPGCPVRVIDRNGGKDGLGATAATVCPPVGAAINASYFAEDLTPIGLLITDGARRRPFHHSDRDWGLFLVRRGAPALAACTYAVPDAVTQAVQCYPRLVVGGATPDMTRYTQRPPARRAAVGLDAQGRLVFAATAGRLSLDQWAACLRTALACPDALNLDGGPSAQLCVRGATTADLPGAYVPAFITVGAKGTK
jgi:hypothetical protein